MTEKLKHINMSPSGNVKNNPNLDVWQKIYCSTFGVMPKQLKEHLKSKQEALLALYDNAEYFKIETQDNPYLEREFEGEIKAMRTMGDDFRADLIERNRERYLIEMAKKFAVHQQVEYQHIIDMLADKNCSDEFRCLMLNETLSRVYYKEKQGTQTYVQPRERGKTIAGHLVLEGVVIEHLLENVCNHQNFASLYFEALDELNKRTLEKGKVNIRGIDTFNKGQWLKFHSKASDEQNFERNSQMLSALSQSTPWCTKTAASSQLELGDFFVFVDNGDKEKRIDPLPHLAVRLIGNQISEVRGILAGQEIEPDYSDVAINFLENNKDVRQGKRWLLDANNAKKQKEFIDRINGYSVAINNESVSDSIIEQLLIDIKNPMGFKNSKVNESIRALENIINRIVPQIARHLGYSEESFYYGNFNPQTDQEVNGVKTIYGDFLFNGAKQKHLNNPIETVIGNVDASNSQLRELDTLHYVSGSVRLNNYIPRVPSLQLVGNELHLARKMKMQRGFTAKRIYLSGRGISPFRLNKISK